MRTIPHWIGGSERNDPGARTGQVFDPAKGTQQASVGFASARLVDEAVQTAHQALTEWRTMSIPRRAQLLFAFRECLNDRKDELAEVVTSEHGKMLSDAAGEIKRGLEVVEFACGIPHLLKGDFSATVSSRVDAYTLRQPVGVVGIISPFNFPAMVPLWFFPVAIACGNTVILKPSEKDPSAAVWLAQRWAEVGLPPGVLNVVHGDKEAVDALLTHREVSAVSFVGSTPVARYVYETASKHGKRVQALGGAKNHMVVLPDADLDAAARAAVSAGYGSAGERCMAISVVIAVEPIGDELVSRIADLTRQLRTGDGRRGCDMGPLITDEHRRRVASYLDGDRLGEAKIVVDGRNAVPDGAPEGFWIGPTLLDHVDPAVPAYTDEIFGPVLSVVRVKSYDDAIAMVNANPYGNGTAVFTRSGGAAQRYQNEVEVGMVGVNVPIPIPMAYYSFGGWKQSLFGDSNAYGTEAVRFYTRTKTVTVRWPEPSDADVIDLGFPTHH